MLSSPLVVVSFIRSLSFHSLLLLHRARAICIRALGDKRPAVRETANEGVDPALFVRRRGEGADHAHLLRFPPAREMLEAAAQSFPALKAAPSSAGASTAGMDPEAMLALLRWAWAWAWPRKPLLKAVYPDIPQLGLGLVRPLELLQP